MRNFLMKGLTSTFIAYYETLTELTDNPFIQYSNIHTVDCKSVTWCMYAWEFLFAFLFHFISFLFLFFCCLLKSSMFAGLVFFFSPAKCKNTEYKKKCNQRCISHNKCVAWLWRKKKKRTESGSLVDEMRTGTRSHASRRSSSASTVECTKIF